VPPHIHAVALLFSPHLALSPHIPIFVHLFTKCSQRLQTFFKMKQFQFGLCAAALLTLMMACQKQTLEPANGLFAPPEQTSNRGVTLPDMDIVMGYTALQQTCSGIPQQIPISANNGVTSFNWAPNDQFIIRATSGSTTEIIRLHTQDGVGEEAGTAYYYKLAHYSCLSNPGTSESSDHKELTISVASNNLTLRGYDNNDTITTRHIAITHPSGYSFTVLKY